MADTQDRAQPKHVARDTQRGARQNAGLWLGVVLHLQHPDGAFHNGDRVFYGFRDYPKVKTQGLGLKKRQGSAAPRT